jgi:hypothetical protein
MTDDSLVKAIKNLAGKKHLISEEAIVAKKNLEKAKQQIKNDPYSKKEIDLLEEFSYSVKMLTYIFRKSRFDDLVCFISNAHRMFIINLILSFIRGIGFTLGVIFILFTFVILLKGLVPIELWQDLLQYFQL